MDKQPLDTDKILKLTFATDFDDNLKELKFSNHSLKKENSKLTVRVKVLYKYLDLDDFSINASAEEMVGLLKGINKVAKKLGISTEVGQGYRALANISNHGGQEVPHLHFHLFGGERVGKMVE